jgi:hypothetical protein
MARVQQVEDAVGEDDFLAGGAQLGAARHGDGKRQEFRIGGREVRHSSDG